MICIYMYLSLLCLEACIRIRLSRDTGGASGGGMDSFSTGAIEIAVKRRLRNPSGPVVAGVEKTQVESSFIIIR